MEIKSAQMDSQDRMVFEMVERAAVRDCSSYYLVDEKQARRLLRYEKEKAWEKEMAPLQGWMQELLRIGGGILRAGTCLIWIGGAADGLMAPAFAVILTGVSALWGVAWVAWGIHNG